MDTLVETKEDVIDQSLNIQYLKKDEDDENTANSRTTLLHPRLNSIKSSSDRQQNGLTFRAWFFMILWYVFSGCTLFLNKYILTLKNGDATLLGATQMLLTTFCGFIQMYFPCYMFKRHSRTSSRPKGFFKFMFFVGVTRFTTVYLGLLALDYGAVSFAETIKSSAPIFTAALSFFIIGEKTGPYTFFSLFPIMGGLLLCTLNELSFTVIGFICAMVTNFTECLQNVVSKKLISGDTYKYHPAELQFFTSLASVIVIIPMSAFNSDFQKVQDNTNYPLMFLFILNGVSFHMQSICAYVLMDYISPVTYSVSNTVKRAVLIWMSVAIFQNQVTLLSGLGTLIIIGGVFLYVQAGILDKRRLLRKPTTE